MPRALASALLAALSLYAQLPSGEWRTDLSKRAIELSELKSGGPPKDGIPAIDRPKFVSPAEAAAWLSPNEPVLVVEHAGQARAYPLQILIWHELVNDQIDDLPILVSYCPLCNSAIVYDRRIDGNVYDFGVSGLLRHSDMVMYDRQTDSLWQQIGGEAIVGTMTGKKLEMVKSQTVSFETFARAFPAGKILSRETGHQRPYGQNPYAGYEFGNRLMMPVHPGRSLPMPPLERIVAVEFEGTSKAYPFQLLRRRGIVEDKIKSRRFVIFFQNGTITALDHRRIASSRDVGAVGVFSPEIEGKRLSFRRKDGKIHDKQTGSTWNLLGMATAGPLAGKRLTPIEHGVYFAFAWLLFNPTTEVVGAPGPALEEDRRSPLDRRSETDSLQFPPLPPQP
jgi:hypothetical protein